MAQFLYCKSLKFDIELDEGLSSIPVDFDDPNNWKAAMIHVGLIGTSEETDHGSLITLGNGTYFYTDVPFVDLQRFINPIRLKEMNGN